jgi:hypothetical protein
MWSTKPSGGCSLGESKCRSGIVIGGTTSGDGSVSASRAPPFFWRCAIKDRFAVTP